MKRFRFLFVLIVASQFCAPSWALPRQAAKVEEVLEGDTIRLVGGKTLKYAGIQSPPLQSLIPLMRQYAEASRQFNKDLVEGKEIQIEWDSQLRDSRGNLIGYVFLSDGTFVNQALLETGNAKARIAAPNTHYAEAFYKAQQAARRDRRGLWKEEPKDPHERAQFVGEKNSKVYYYADSPELSRFSEANFVYFDSRVDALAAGYKPCPTCRGDRKYSSEAF